MFRTIFVLINFCLNVGLKLFKIVYDPFDGFEHGCLMSEDSALYGFGKELMPNLQIVIGFSSDCTEESKIGQEKNF